MSNQNKTKTLEVNRNILGCLVAFSAKTGKAVDYQKALTYPLCPIPLSLAHPDGNRRQTDKAELWSTIMKDYSKSEPSYPSHHLPDSSSQEGSAFIVDLIALLRTQVAVPDKYI